MTTTKNHNQNKKAKPEGKTIFFKPDTMKNGNEARSQDVQPSRKKTRAKVGETKLLH